MFYELPLEEIGDLSASACRRSRRTTSSASRAQYIRPDRLSIVLVGNAKAFVPQLRAVGFTDFDVIPLDELDLMSATLKKEPRAPVRGPGRSTMRIMISCGEASGDCMPARWRLNCDAA